MTIKLSPASIELTAIRAQGAGGQNVNKVASAIHLRFNIHTSGLRESIKERLLALRDSRVTDEGIVVIKAQQHRTQELNKADAFDRLHSLIESVAEEPVFRRATKPSYGAKQRRLKEKSVRSDVKASRGKLNAPD